MPATEQDLRALMHLAKRIRDDTTGARKWDDTGLWAELRPLAGHNLAITCERVLRHAADPTAKTPGAIRRPFLPDPPAPETARNPRPGEDCPHHPGKWPTGCPGCVVDQIAGDDRPAPRRPRERPGVPMPADFPRPSAKEQP